MDTNTVQRQLYGIAIFEEEIVLADFTGRNEQRFVVSPEQLQGFFRSEATFRPFPGLVWMKSGMGSDRYLLTLPAGKRTILYRKAKKLLHRQLRLPAVAVEVDLQNGDIEELNIWGFAGRTLQADSVLYELPLPNLNESDMCLGSTEKAVGGDVRSAVEKTLFDTPFNHHNHLVGTERIPFLDYVKKYGGTCPLRTLNKIGLGRDIL